MSGRKRQQMADGLLTTQQVQGLLGVDASTIYRMAGDGRLPAVRVGRQWRFPADGIDALLQPGDVGIDAEARHGSPRAPSFEPSQPPHAPSRPLAAAVAVPAEPADSPLSPELAVAVLEVVAPAIGVSMVVTDLAGQPLTPIINPAPAIIARSQDPDFGAACATEWRGFAQEPHLAPRLGPGRFGFLCAHSLVRQGASLVAMVLAGGIAPPGSDDPDLFDLDADARALVLETLPRTAALLSHLVPPAAPSSQDDDPHTT